MLEFTHLNEDGRGKMVEISEKSDTSRCAIAKGKVFMNEETVNKIREASIKKGDVLSIAQIAGIMGAKRTPDLIPLCHPLMLTGVDMELVLKEDGVEIEARVKTFGKTGVEMEALTAVSIGALTVYDMCKAVDKGMIISDIRLMMKEGGKSGKYVR
jgi:cyclic pyranopterin phosphate synthase